jgi:thiol-disulfide isomerase/thioredoxin
MKIRKVSWFWLLALFVLAATWVMAEEGIRTLEIGASAPDFRLPATDGRSYTLGDFADSRVLVVIFTTNHCPTAQAYEERIKQMVRDYRDKGVAFVAISPNDPKAVRLDELGWSDLNDTFEEMKLRAVHREFNFPYLYDGDIQEVSRAYGPTTTPHTFIFDQERKLRYIGRIDENERRPQEVKNPDARNAIEALLEGRQVPVERTRAFGCSVKWSDKRQSVKESFEKWAQEEVTLATIDSEAVRNLLKNDSDKLRMINVWATWCGPCVVEFPDLVTIHRMYRGREFELVTISADDMEDRERALAFLKKQESSTRNYIFEGNPYDLFDALEAETDEQNASGALPFTILVKPGGEVVYRHEGRIDPLVAKREIIKVLGYTYQ